ncbi:efflux RND transporter permease subunit [Flavobacterium crassostreae]|uniref:Metal transporter n=1 Tax=Flavobacterium crassostreae TaxID=1763534 RepID=A0A1B9DXI1_9FLAO|nr:efflux RND transporter permease subunit [Flavobacterium crassostreae]OCB74401.1 metal transporter [Flavobacterium crassostreae]
MKKLIQKITQKQNDPLSSKERIQLIEKSSKLVGPGVFYSTLIVIASFLPVFLLTGIEGKLFSPLAWTKSFILIVDAFLAITLTPVLISFLLKGKLRPENKNPINKRMERLYTPVLTFCLKWRKSVLAVNSIALLIGGLLFTQLGSEFMPPLDEGSILFMPVTLPDISNSEIKRILQVQDKLIQSIPEVEHVLGKAGRANTATDNSPISMIETIVLLKPHAQWREGKTKKDIITEINNKLQIPGVTNGFTQPIINRINMLATGVRTDVGIKIYGANLDTIAVLSQKIKATLEGTSGVKDLFAEPITGGKYIDIIAKREVIGRYGLSIDAVNNVVQTAIGGMVLTTTIAGRQRFSVNARYAQEFRNSIEGLKKLQIQTTDFGPIPLETVADITISDGPAMLNSENAMLRGSVLFNVRDRDLGSTVKEAQDKLNAMLHKLPKGYYLEWSGQWENQIRANQTLLWIMPLVILIIFMILYFTYGSLKEAFITMITVPFALVGGIFMVYFYGINLSVAVAVGFIALFGLAIETAMLITIYLNEAMVQMVAKHGNSSQTLTEDIIREYIISGSAKRLRPKLMTVSVALFGLVPILWSTGTGADVMIPITIPLIGGTITSTIYVLLVTPVVFEMSKLRELKTNGKIEIIHAKH